MEYCRGRKFAAEFMQHHYFSTSAGVNGIVRMHFNVGAGTKGERREFKRRNLFGRFIMNLVSCALPVALVTLSLMRFPFTIATTILAFVIGVLVPIFARATNSLERFAPDFSTNTAILWQPPTMSLPKSLWIYKRLPPQPFLASVISNAIAIASLQDRGIPKPSTNDFFIWSPPDSCGVRHSIFSIMPAKTEISYCSPNQSLSTDYVPNDETVKKRAFDLASQLGLGARWLIPQNIFCSSNSPGYDGKTTNGCCARGIFLSRNLDGVAFYSNGGVDEADGFSVEFGSHCQVRAFSLVWPNLERSQNCKTASPQEIINCLRERRFMVIPNPDEETYFERLKNLSKAKTFTITKITPLYGEGVFGEASTNDIPPKFIVPFAEIEAVASFGSNNSTVKLISPVLSSEIARLIGKK